MRKMLSFTVRTAILYGIFQAINKTVNKTL